MMNAVDNAVIDVRSLRVLFKDVVALADVSVHVPRGEIVGIVGESGSGKSVLLKSIVGLVDGDPGAVEGDIDLCFADGTRVRLDAGPGLSARRRRLRQHRLLSDVRGARIGLVLQNGRAALDPFRTVGTQVQHAIRVRQTGLRSASSSAERHDEAMSWLERLSFEDPAGVARRFPHELSGGMAQRAMLATVLARKPEVLLLDEVNTGLDATVQAELLQLLERIHATEKFSALFVSHDIGATLRLASRVVVMRRGHVVETTDVPSLRAGHVEHDYTDQLLRAAVGAKPPQPPTPADLVSDLASEVTPLVRLEHVGKRFRTRGAWGAQRTAQALYGVSASIPWGQCVAIVGESGSGKTTLARMLVGLTDPSEGTIRFASLARRLRRRILFQNPYTSLNTQMTPLEAVAEILRHEGMEPDDALSRASIRLAEFGLQTRMHHLIKFLSGGERRRVGIVRALASSADLVVLDEPTSNLDAVYRTRVAAELTQLRATHPNRTLVIVSHDLRFVRAVAQRVIVLQRGTVVDDQPVSALDRPDELHAYTRALLWAAKTISGAKLQPEPEARPAQAGLV